MWEMKRLLPLLAAAAMLVLSIGCTSNDAEVEQLRKELDEIKAAIPVASPTPQRSATATPQRSATATPQRSATATPQRSATATPSQTVPSNRLPAVKTLFNLGYARLQQGDYAAAIADYTSAVKRYSADADPAIREVVAVAREELAKLAD